MVIEGLSAGVTVVNASGSCYGEPYPMLTCNGLAHCGSRGVQVRFKRNAGTAVSYNPVAYTAGV